MDALTIPAPRSPRAEVTSLVPLRMPTMFLGDDVTPTVRPAAPKEPSVSNPDIAAARKYLAQAAEARIAEQEADKAAGLARERREAAFVRVMELTTAGALRTAIALAEAVEKAAQAELDVWTAAEWRFDDEARDCGRAALNALRGGDSRAAADEWSDVNEEGLTVDAYAARVLAELTADRAA